MSYFKLAITAIALKAYDVFKNFEEKHLTRAIRIVFFVAGLMYGLYLYFDILDHNYIRATVRCSMALVFLFLAFAYQRTKLTNPFKP